MRALSGPAAIRILGSRNDIDLILMDLQMPVLDGFETASRIKQMDRGLSGGPLGQKGLCGRWDRLLRQALWPRVAQAQGWHLRQSETEG